MAAEVASGVPNNVRPKETGDRALSPPTCAQNHLNQDLQPVAFKVYKFHAASSTPDWEYDGHAVGLSSWFLWMPGTLATTPDGSVLAVRAMEAAGAVILFFHPGSPTPFSIHRNSQVAYPVELRLTEDGASCLYYYSDTIFRVQVATGDIEARHVVGTSFNLGMSPDGSVIATGLISLRVSHWTDTEYVDDWTFTPAGSGYASAVAVAADNDRIFAVWPDNDSGLIQLRRFSRAAGNAPRWTWETGSSARSQRDYVSWIDISAAGDYVALGTWGTPNGAPPQLIVLADASPATPLFAYRAVGSIFSVDISPDGKWVAAANRPTYANIMSNGGDVLLAQLR